MENLSQLSTTFLNNDTDQQQKGLCCIKTLHCVIKFSYFICFAEDLPNIPAILAESCDITSPVVTTFADLPNISAIPAETCDITSPAFTYFAEDLPNIPTDLLLFQCSCHFVLLKQQLPNILPIKNTCTLPIHLKYVLMLYINQGFTLCFAMPIVNILSHCL